MLLSVGLSSMYDLSYPFMQFQFVLGWSADEPTEGLGHIIIKRGGGENMNCISSGVKQSKGWWSATCAVLY